MNENGKFPANAITNFQDAPFLSNFYEAKVEYNGLTYGSSEAAYQAQKCVSEEERLVFIESSPAKSKSLGKKVKYRPDWEKVKLGIYGRNRKGKVSSKRKFSGRTISYRR